MARPQRIVVGTRNRGKLAELRTLLADLGIEVVSIADFRDAPEVVEDGDTFESNAVKKATEIARAIGEWVVADDSGLEVDALGGAPGLRSARFAGGDAENVRRLLAELKDSRNRGARFRCVLALVRPAGPRYLAEGCLEGEIATEPRGTAGFGYDPVFLVPPLGKTLAELSFAEKQTMSHRARAAERLKKLLATSA